MGETEKLARNRFHASTWRRRTRSQRGFTLIEMLVVIGILGILASIVTMSMVGITSLAEKRANDGELTTLQSAMDAMIMTQGIDPAAACGGAARGPQQDMSRFPVGPVNPGDLSRQPPPGSPAPLYPRYVRKQMMRHSYVCTPGGGVQPAGG